jgi:hypothetical protein
MAIPACGTVTAAVRDVYGGTPHTRHDMGYCRRPRSVAGAVFVPDIDRAKQNGETNGVNRLKHGGEIGTNCAVPLRLVSIIATGDPDRVYLCHCEACQRRTGTPFHFGATYPKERVRLEGERRVYERDADSGYGIRFHFCPNCGGTLYWEGDRNPAACGVAVGAFDTSDFPPPSDSIWEESMYPWLGLPPRMEHHQQGRSPVP